MRDLRNNTPFQRNDLTTLDFRSFIARLQGDVVDSWVAPGYTDGELVECGVVGVDFDEAAAAIKIPVFLVQSFKPYFGA